MLAINFCMSIGFKVRSIRTQPDLPAMFFERNHNAKFKTYVYLVLFARNSTQASLGAKPTRRRGLYFDPAAPLQASHISTTQVYCRARTIRSLSPGTHHHQTNKSDTPIPSRHPAVTVHQHLPFLFPHHCHSSSLQHQLQAPCSKLKPM